MATRPAPQPCWKIAVITPYAAPTDSRFSTIAVPAITGERNATSISRKVTTSTNANTGRIEWCNWSLKSTPNASCPPTATLAPDSSPKVCGTTCVRKVFSACTDAASVPFPANGTSICATLADR